MIKECIKCLYGYNFYSDFAQALLFAYTLLSVLEWVWLSNDGVW